MRRLRTLSETECRTRLYGGAERTVRLVPREERGRRATAGPSAAERLRRLLEDELDVRRTEAPPEAA